MSNLFKLVVKALAQLPGDELDIVVQLAYALMPDDEPTNEHDPVAQQLLAAPSWEPARRVKASQDKAKHLSVAQLKQRQANLAKARAKRWPKKKGKLKDVNESLANRKGFTKPGTKTAKATGITAAILRTLSQTDGKLGSQEVAEFTDTSMYTGNLKSKAGKVSMVLSGLARGKNSKLKVHREAARISSANGKQVPGYLYWVDEATKALIKKEYGT